MNSIEKIIEGMKLIKEGCSETPAGNYNCDKSTCPFGWLCYGEKIDPPEYWYIPTPQQDEEDEPCEKVAPSNLGGYDKVADQLIDLWF